MDRIVNMMNQMGGKSVMKKKLIVTGLAMFVVLATIFSVVPGIMGTAQAGNVVTAFSSNPDFYSQPVEIKDLEGVVYGADEELDTPKTDFNAELSRVNLVYQEDGLRFSAVLTYDGSQYEVFAKGVLYPLISGGIHDSKRLVAELRTQNEFSIVQFKVRNVGNEGVAKLRISIENTITGDLFSFRGSINRSDFDTILGYANRRVEMLTKGLDAGTAAFDDAIKRIQSKTIQLSNINNHLVHPRTSRDPGEMVVVYGEAVEGTKGEVTEGINSYGAIVRAAVGYHDLDNLFNDLKTFGTVNLSNYNVPESIFRGDGWQQYHNISSPPRFFYVRYGAVQIGYTLTQITLVETIAGNVSGNRYLIQNRVKHGMITEYCHHTHTLCVFILDFGPSLRNWEQIMTRLQGQHVFISRRMDGLLLETGSFWRAAIALVPYAKTVWETWEHLDYRETQSPLDYELFFELTFADQNDKYRGSVIRGIVGDFSDYTLRNEGHFASTKGIVYLTGFSLTWSYRGNVHHNL